MSDYEKLLEKYEHLMKDTQELAKYKILIQEQLEEIERLNRIIKQREREIVELSLLVKVSK